MAKAPKDLIGAAALPVTTACYVDMRAARFEDPTGNFDPDLLAIDCKMSFNGPTPEAIPVVYFARNATASARQTAVRDLVNLQISYTEPGVTLNNANINIAGMPI